MSKLLLDEHPLIILPNLAVKIGLNEAIVLQQVHYWLLNNSQNGKFQYMGETWTGSSIEDWKKKNFPFWSSATIRRIIKNLEDKGVLISAQPKAGKHDQTKWYRIDYDVFNEICENGFAQNEQLGEVKMSNSHIIENTLENSISSDDDDYSPEVESSFLIEEAVKKPIQEKKKTNPLYELAKVLTCQKITDPTTKQITARIPIIKNVLKENEDLTPETFQKFFEWYRHTKSSDPKHIPERAETINRHLADYLASEQESTKSEGMSLAMMKKLGLIESEE